MDDGIIVLLSVQRKPTQSHFFRENRKIHGNICTTMHGVIPKCFNALIRPVKKK